MKWLSLFSRQFSRFWIREVMLAIQTAAMIVLMIPVASDIADLLKVEQLASQLIRPAYFMQAAGYYQTSESLGEDAYGQYLINVDELTGEKNVGRTSHAMANIDNGTATIRFYSEALAKNIYLPTRCGLQNYSAFGDQIPLVISTEMANSLSVGQVFSTTLYWPVSGRHVEATFIVVGVLDDDGYYFSLLGGASEPVLESIGGKNSEDRMQAIAFGGFEKVPALDVSPSCLIFTDSESEEVRDTLNTALWGLGKVCGISEMRHNSLLYILKTHSMLILSGVMMLLLCLTGMISFTWMTTDAFIGRYSVYYILGMNRMRGFSTLVALQWIPLLLGAGIAVLVGQYVWEPWMHTGDGLRVSLLIIVPVTAIVTLLMSLRFHTADPVLKLRSTD